MLEKIICRFNRHRHKAGDCCAANFYIERVFAQASAAAFIARRIPAVLAQKHAVLNFVRLPLHHLEKPVDAVELTAVPVHDDI